MLFKFLKIFTPLQWIKFILVIIVAITALNFSRDITSYISGKLGMETKENLKERTIKQAEIINDLSSANKNLAESINLIGDSSKITQNAVVIAIKEEVKINDTLGKLKESKTIKINKVKQEYENVVETPQNKVELNKEISKIQINVLWEMYCSDISHAEQCKKLIT